MRMPILLFLLFDFGMSVKIAHKQLTVNSELFVRRIVTDNYIQKRELLTAGVLKK